MLKKILILLVLLLPISSFSTPPEQVKVFQITQKVISPNSLNIHWNLADGFFLYKDSIKIKIDEKNNFHVGSINFPKPLVKTNNLGKKDLVYAKSLDLNIPILGTSQGNGLLEITYQGCSEEGFCYPPSAKFLKIKIDSNLELVKSTNIDNKEDIADTSDLGQMFYQKNTIFIILSFFILGLLLSFTPCILPMIPVLSGIIVGSKNLSTKKGFFLSLCYVTSMSLTYALIGGFFAYLGSNLQMIMQSPTVIISFSILFILLALSMFGLFELRLPQSLQNKLMFNKKNHYPYIGACIMGALSILILSPCVTPPLIAVLGYVAHTGNIMFGMMILFTLSMGTGTPLLLIGTSAAKFLPKSGKWMHGVKIFFGILMLAVAIYLLQRVIPEIRRNHTDFPHTIVKTSDETNKAIANSIGKPIMLDFYATWCASCKMMEQTTLKNPKVQEILKKYAVYKVDITKSSNDMKALLKNFNIVAPPTYIFLDANGKEIPDSRIIGEVSVDKFIEKITSSNT